MQACAGRTPDHSRIVLQFGQNSSEALFTLPQSGHSHVGPSTGDSDPTGISRVTAGSGFAAGLTLNVLISMPDFGVDADFGIDLPAAEPDFGFCGTGFDTVRSAAGAASMRSGTEGDGTIFGLPPYAGYSSAAAAAQSGIRNSPAPGRFSMSFPLLFAAIRYAMQPNSISTVTPA